MTRQPYPTPGATDSIALRIRNPSWTPRPTECTTTATQDNLWATYCGNGPPSGGFQAACPQTAQHSVRNARRQTSLHQTTPPQRSDQPTDPTAIPGCTHAALTHGILRAQPSHPAKRRTHSLCRPQIFKHGAGHGTSGAGQAAGAPRPRPRRRHPTAPSTNTPDPPSASPQDRPTKLRTTRTTRDSSPTPDLVGTHLTQFSKQCNPVAPGYPARAPQPKSKHPKTSFPGVPGTATKDIQTRSSF